MPASRIAKRLWMRIVLDMLRIMFTDRSRLDDVLIMDRAGDLAEANS